MADNNSSGAAARQQRAGWDAHLLYVYSMSAIVSVE